MTPIPHETTQQRLDRVRERHRQHLLKLRTLQHNILTAIDTLTPPNVQECSTHEILAKLQEDGHNGSLRGLAAHLGKLRTEGLVKSRTYMQRHLWTLTPAGRRWVTKPGR